MLQFALVGCGNISNRHAENINRVGKLTSVCDIVREKADALALKYNVKAYYHIDDLLKNEISTEVIVICTPNGLHADQTIKSLHAGKHVLCEKPMSLTTADGCKMISAAEKNQRKIFVVKQNRYNEPVKYVKKLLDEKKLGQVFSFQLNCFWNRPQAYYTGSWKGSKDLDGGILYTQFSHFIDLLHWLLGDVDEVKGYKYDFGKRSQFEIEDTGVAILKMESGAIGTLNYSVNSYSKNLEGSLSIFGEKGSVKIGGQYLNTLEWHEVEGLSKPELTTSPAANNYGFYQGSMSNHHKVYDELILSLNGNGNLLEGRDAVKTVEIIEFIYKESSEE